MSNAERVAAHLRQGSGALADRSPEWVR